MVNIEASCFSTPIGELCGIVRGNVVLYLHRPLLLSGVTRGEFAERLKREIEEYFSGRRKSFSFRPLIRGSALRKKVFEEVLRIPYGSTITYGELAARVGSSPRAVGRVLSENRILLVIPCHRVVASKGVGGYALGVEAKKYLLRLEASNR